MGSVIPDVGPLGSVAGWAVAVIAVFTILGYFARAFLKGDLYPKSVVAPLMARVEAQDKVTADLVPLVKAIVDNDKLTAMQMDFLVAFVRSRDRDDVRDREADRQSERQERRDDRRSEGT